MRISYMNTSRIVSQKKNEKVVKHINSRKMKGNNPIRKTCQNTVSGADVTLFKTMFGLNRCHL